MATYIKKYTVTISTAAGGLSGAISLEGTTPFAIEMSTGWTAAGITLQASQDETNFYNVYQSDGTELAFTVGASQYVVITVPEQLIGLQALKLRSGTSTAAVAQAATRTLTLFARGL